MSFPSGEGAVIHLWALNRNLGNLENLDQIAFFKIEVRDFPGGPVADSLLPIQGAWVQSLVRELDSHMPQLRPGIIKLIK